MLEAREAKAATSEGREEVGGERSSERGPTSCSVRKTDLNKEQMRAEEVRGFGLWSHGEEWRR